MLIALIVRFEQPADMCVYWSTQLCTAARVSNKLTYFLTYLLVCLVRPSVRTKNIFRQLS